jgi:hypothetical protein
LKRKKDACLGGRKREDSALCIFLLAEKGILRFTKGGRGYIFDYFKYHLDKNAAAKTRVRISPILENFFQSIINFARAHTKTQSSKRSVPTAGQKSAGAHTNQLYFLGEGRSTVFILIFFFFDKHTLSLIAKIGVKKITTLLLLINITDHIAALTLGGQSSTGGVAG